MSIYKVIFTDGTSIMVTAKHLFDVEAQVLITAHRYIEDISKIVLIRKGRHNDERDRT